MMQRCAPRSRWTPTSKNSSDGRCTSDAPRASRASTRGSAMPSATHAWPKRSRPRHSISVLRGPTSTGAWHWLALEDAEPLRSLRAGKEAALGRQEGVGSDEGHSVVVESPPGAAFVMVESEFVLEFLVVALDAPAELREADQLADLGLLGHGGEPVLRRLAAAFGPSTRRLRCDARRRVGAQTPASRRRHARIARMPGRRTR